MRPLAAAVVAAVARTRTTPDQLTLTSLVVFALGAAMLVAMPDLVGGALAVLVLELSYLFDCADGMLARHKKVASQVGHLFDFFTDETKATMLAAALGIRHWRTGGLGIDGQAWPAGSPGFLLGGIACVAVIGSATSLTNFVRRPEVSGKATPIEAHYEAEGRAPSTVARLLALPKTFLQFLNHYPSHLYVFAALGRLDLFLWIYLLNNGLYLAVGWLGLFRRFGRFTPPASRSTD
ncbi:MAG: CDP-alcohol phosphatidyltransferase family protein, partial [Deltaproteobacteria bacterium]|nr:CDP-alcohol phosphatidyltransferase family protein [Deltaproteobacteria bacterium]